VARRVGYTKVFHAPVNSSTQSVDLQAAGVTIDGPGELGRTVTALKRKTMKKTLSALGVAASLIALPAAAEPLHHHRHWSPETATPSHHHHGRAVRHAHGAHHAAPARHHPHHAAHLIGRRK
jgi:hypothetical protein